MTLTLDIPDVLTASLGKDVPRVVLEGFAIQAYRSGTLSSAEIRQLLGHESRWDTEAFLSAHNVWPDPAAEEVEGELERLISLRAS
ncbi:uncharacterized protein UPF0175 [Prosthecobacter fusiformis]|uniref:Uncharacterized protein UPF0175 n=1 Tax=Prosthecobacter fusiformis TaxID=48464 RepID=A0A4R7RZG0_9BACT|nr:UPF0175 family protein [Prosthecobacter fusiformis]TDU71350.1 uncharacterized protein UPF0175 [Prosthecobacter fusiformis]